MATLSRIPLGHYQLKSANELAEGFVFPLGQTPEIDIRSFSIYEHRVLFEKFRCELSKSSDRISLKACDPFEGCSFQVLDEQAERLLHSLEGLEVIEVFRIDIGDDGDIRRQLQEGAVALVRLDHHPVARPEPRIGAVGIDDPAVDHGRI